MQQTILIHKETTNKQKNIIRINSEEDIPMFLLNSIFVKDKKICLIFDGNLKFYPIGSVIGWDINSSTNTGFICWYIDPISQNLVEKEDGTFYSTTILKTLAIDNEFPEFLEGANITENQPNSWSIENEQTERTAQSGQGYWVLYGTKEDGTLDADILLKTDPSYRDYIVCDENGKDLGKLCEIDPA